MAKIALGIAGVFAVVLTLFFVTLESAPESPPSGVEHDVAGAANECTAVVTSEFAGARFPFSPTASYLGDRLYRLNGTVDAGTGSETVRRNYECLVRYEGFGNYRTDSVKVWQSH